MTGLVVAPTTDTVQGWLIIAVLAVLLVSVGAGALALWDAAMRAHAKRDEFDAELAHQRDAAFGYCRTLSVDGHPVRIHSDRPIDQLDDGDRAAVDLVLALVRDRLQQMLAETS